MSKILYVLGFFLTAISFCSCGDDDDVPAPDPDYSNSSLLPYAIYESKGVVLNAEGQPLKDIKVTLSPGFEILEKNAMVVKYYDLDNGTATTNEKGEYTISSAYAGTLVMYLKDLRVVAEDPSGVYQSQTTVATYDYKIVDEQPELDLNKYRWNGRYGLEANFKLPK